MKAISSTVYDYYLIRGIVDKDITKSNILLVKYMCPSNKLKLADDGDTQQLIKLKGDEAKTYKLTKSLAKKYCTIWQKYSMLNKLIFKKKDDMVDSFSRMYYLRLIKLSTIKYVYISIVMTEFRMFKRYYPSKNKLTSSLPKEMIICY